MKVADPTGRLLTISCGAALHHAVVTLAADGWSPHVDLMPAGPEADLLATIHVGDPGPPDPDAAELAELIPRRRTDRRSLMDRPVPEELLTQLRNASEAYQVHLHLLPPQQRADLAVAAERANQQASANPAFHQELANWVGGTHPPGIGIPAGALPDRPGRTAVPLREFGVLGTLPLGDTSDRAATYAMFFGEQDNTDGWLRTGEALSAVWLLATRHGVALLPFSGVIESPVTRIFVSNLLAGVGHPYLVIRLGYPDPQLPEPPATPRLAAEVTIDRLDGAQ